jgi:BirA family transcriptional regulator, biotin operon repressor / biotin---[acetyl-CoA-carboxylase] ligase
MRYLQLKFGLGDKIKEDYLNVLYRYQILSNYSCADEIFKAKIIGLNPTGELILETESGEQRSFGFKEVAFEL